MVRWVLLVVLLLSPPVLAQASDELVELRKEVAELRAENIRLRQQIAALLPRPATRPATSPDFEDPRISYGMTRRDVDRVLGRRPDEISELPQNMQKCVWEYKRRDTSHIDYSSGYGGQQRGGNAAYTIYKTITVQFQDGRAFMAKVDDQDHPKPERLHP